MPSLDFHEVAALPRLAWLAVVERGAVRARVFHGPAVECRDRWMVEGVWDGDFAAGGFHDSPHFFGSGIRVDGDRLLFVKPDRKSTRLNSSHVRISYALF